jgi:hypothetical protein
MRAAHLQPALMEHGTGHKYAGGEGTMRGLRNLKILAAAGTLVLGLGTAGWAQSTNGQNNGTNPPAPVNKPIKPPSAVSDGADSSGPFRSQQGTTAPGIGSPEPIVPAISGEDRPRDSRLEQNQEKLRNLDRQKKLVDDTAKLVSLANELKSEVDKSNKDMLSLDVIKKADEIEKLAHSVKEKMKGI